MNIFVYKSTRGRPDTRAMSGGGGWSSTMGTGETGDSGERGSEVGDDGMCDVGGEMGWDGREEDRGTTARVDGMGECGV